MSRGVLYMVWGARATGAVKRSIASVQQYHPELPTKVIELPSNTHPLKGLLEKSKMMELSPFDETLFLDADTVVLDRLDFGFEQASRFGVACCICESPWARRYQGLPKDDGIEYNTGVLFFTRGAEQLFRRWQELAPVVDSAIDFIDEKASRRSAPTTIRGHSRKQCENGIKLHLSCRSTGIFGRIGTGPSSAQSRYGTTMIASLTGLLS